VRADWQCEGTTKHRPTDTAHVFPRLLDLLEQLIGDRWLFDRAALLDTADSATPG
jgi:hypothetical protein